MGAGAKNEAIRLTAAAAALIDSLDGGPALTDDDASRLARLFDHGMSRRVDQRIRKLSSAGAGWVGIDVDRLSALVAHEPAMVVLAGAHPNGRVRQRAVELAAALISPTEGDPPARPPVGVARMLALRSLDPVPQIRAIAVDALERLFAAELASGREGRMLNGTERAAREIVAQVRSVTACPQLVSAALDLFEQRTGRYVINGVRDHHRRTLHEIDRRSQLLVELEAMAPQLTDETTRSVAARLVDFYQRSLLPLAADDPSPTEPANPLGQNSESELPTR